AFVLEDRHFAVCAEDVGERGDDLPLGGSRPHAFEDGRHDVLRAGGDFFQGVETRGHADSVARLTQAPDPFRLFALYGLVDHQDWRRTAVDPVPEGADADDHALARLQQALIAKCRIGDLALRIALVDGGEHAAP